MKARRQIEVSGLLALVAAVGVVTAAQVLEGASIRALWQPTAALIVFGGTLAAVCISYPMALVRRTVGTVHRTFTYQAVPAESAVQQMVLYAQTSRRKGLLALEPEIEHASDPFLRLALSLTVDGSGARSARDVLEIENAARLAHDEAPAEVLESAAGYAPTLGILGAVLGLIHVMQSLGEPSTLGRGIAVAFVATVYGVGSANLVLLPLATKLRRQAYHASVTRELIMEGVAALYDGVNPRVLEQKLRGFVLASRDTQPARRAA